MPKLSWSHAQRAKVPDRYTLSKQSIDKREAFTEKQNYLILIQLMATGKQAGLMTGLQAKDISFKVQVQTSRLGSYRVENKYWKVLCVAEVDVHTAPAVWTDAKRWHQGKKGQNRDNFSFWPISYYLLSG